jgi:ATP-dependent DNA ligase
LLSGGTVSFSSFATGEADGYRLRRHGERVGLITRGGYNWTNRYPWIIEAARKIGHQQFVLDGEAVILVVSSK